ncbi:MAG: DNA topoisomerase (ATP-hydrolyzing) subunit B [Planctomycetales bacterium]|nr:DNA topoisomerase (ATP-hydrolyzing) subunit B [Planctomycetales bacterium]
MYIGDVGTRGYHHILYEAVDNSVDEAMAGYAREIVVTLHTDGSVSVLDDGRGIPVDIHPETGRPAVEVCLTKLRAGGKFSQKVYKASGGLHGVGISATNALSEWFEVEVMRDGGHFNQRYARGVPTNELTRLGKSAAHGTKVTFKPDAQIFGEQQFSFEVLAKRLRELAFLNAGLSIRLSDERTEKAEGFRYEGGLVAFVQHANENKGKIHPEVIAIRRETKLDGGRPLAVSIAMQYNDEYAESIFTYVNNIPTEEGGTHLTGFRAALTRTFNAYARAQKMFKDEGESLQGEDLREGLVAVLSVLFPEPQFEGQTKSKLGNSEVGSFVETTVNEELEIYLEEHPAVAKAILEKAVRASEAREAARKARDLIRRKGALSSGSLPGKLADCQSKDRDESEMFIVEGDSAGGCFSGDTKVALADGRDVTFEQLGREWSAGRRHFAYTVLPGNHVRLAPITNVRVTRRSAVVVKVTLDNGEEIVCTPDHRFMLRDGSYRAVQDLRAGDSLMPLRRQLSRKGRRITIEGYEMVFDPGDSRWIFTHLLADAWNIAVGVYSTHDGEHRHHRDGNKRNNNPTNIARLSPAEHLEHHRRHLSQTLHRPDVKDRVRELHRTEEFRKKIREAMSRPEMRRLLRERARRQWENPEYRRYMMDAFLSFYRSRPDYQERNRAALDQAQRSYWADPRNRKCQAERLRRLFETEPERRETLRQLARRQWSDETLKAWRRGATREQWTESFRARRTRTLAETYRRKGLGLLRELLSHTGQVSADAYDAERRRRRDKSLLRFDTLCERYFEGDASRLEEAVRLHNHRVRSVEPLDEHRDVYDLEVPETHNFALAAGVFVHNSAKQARDRRFQAILPIRGKILNVEKARLDKMLGHAEIQTIVSALGTGIGQDEFKLDDLRYGRIILLTDADVDGSHIRTLLLTFFFRQMPALIEHGHVYAAQPPLYRVARKGSERYVQTDGELTAELVRRGLEEAAVERAGGGGRLEGDRLRRLVETLQKAEAPVRGLARRGVSVADLLPLRDRETGAFPLYRAEYGGKVHYFASDTLRDQFLQGIAERHRQEPTVAAAEGAPPAGAEEENDAVRLVELHGSKEFGEALRDIESLGLRAEDYARSADAPPLFMVKSGEVATPVRDLACLAEALRAAGQRGVDVQRFKGLGEMQPEQLWETTMDPAKRTLLRVRVSDAIEADRIFTVLMGEVVEPRREFIEKYAREVRYLDV